MKKAILFLAMGIFTLTVNAQTETETQGQAVIEFESTEIDYGKIEKGSDGERTFRFTNTGDIPLIVNRVYSTCGCTVPSQPTEAILPGESGEIVVKYDTKRVGPIRKTLSVYSNSIEPIVPITIKGEVFEPEQTSVLENGSGTGPRS